jgi:hypothetical protein
MLFALGLLSASPASGVETSPTAILDEPDRFDAQPVTLHGTVANFQARRSGRGNAYFVFDLSDGRRAIRVFSFGASDCKTGSTATVEGRFFKVKRQGQYEFYDQVDATTVVCR